MRLNCVDEILNIGYHECYESAFKTWEGREEESKIEDAFIRDLGDGSHWGNW